jgi:hypothetical protein
MSTKRQRERLLKYGFSPNGQAFSMSGSLALRESPPSHWILMGTSHQIARDNPIYSLRSFSELIVKLEEIIPLAISANHSVE